MPGGKYILEGKEPKLVKNLFEWAQWMQTGDRIVAKTKRKDVEVSTVFLGLDPRFFTGGKPLLFETMVFGCKFNLEQERYHTRNEAEEGHQRMVAKVFKQTSRPRGWKE